jgi:hypothetical protein
MPEYNPYADLYADLAGDVFDAGAAILPPMSGASPGLFEDLQHIGGDVLGYTLNPALSFLGGVTGGVVKDAWAAAEAAWHRVTYHVYALVFGAFQGMVNTPTNIRFFNPENVKFLSSHWFLGETFRLIVIALDVLKGWGLEWIKDRVWEFLGYGAYGFGSLFQGIATHVSGTAYWVRDRVSELLGLALWGFPSMIAAVNGLGTAAATWLRDRIYDGLGHLAKGFPNMAAFVERKLSDFGTWAYNNIGAPILAEVKKVGLTVISGAQDVVGFFVNALEHVLLGPVDALVSLVEHKLTIPGRMMRGDYADGFALLNDLLDPPPELMRGFTGLLLMPFMVASAMYGALGAFGPVYWEGPKQELLRKIGPTLLTTDDVYDAWNRKFITEATAIDQLKRRGYAGEVLTAMQKLRYRLPPLSDVTRMAVREVFSPSRQALQLDADYPGDALTQAGLGLGLEEVWTRNYWAAHWDLPSPTQGYEMLHRNVINPADLDALLKALDYSPAWRGKLAQISYRPLTRVDIRRMYAARVLTETEVKRAYLDLGYNDINATRITEFTKRNYAPQDATAGTVNRELTASLIRESYRRHVITRDDAAARLIDIGYDGEETEFQLDIDDARLAKNPTADAAIPVRDLTTGALLEAYRENVLTRAQVTTELTVLGYAGNEISVLLSLEDIRVGRDYRNARAAEVKERYIGRTIDYATAVADLNAIGVKGNAGVYMIAEWGADLRRGERKLTVAEVFNALKFKYFTNEQALAYLRRLGYNDADSGILMRLRTGG